MTVPPYKVLVLTCMVNCTAGKQTPQLCSVVWWPVHWAPSQTTWFLVLAGARHCALETCGKKKCELCFQALLNLYTIYVTCIHFVNHMYVDISCNFISVVLCSVVRWSVHWAPSQTTQVLVLAGSRRCAFEMCRKKKMQAALLGLAKPIYYVTCIHFVNNMYVDVSCNFISVVVDAEQSKYYQ